ncbi:MAG: thiamine phosphate synthase [Rhodospirillaceae bacterium]|nr:thiamine phosphate synthase [Rhodospirillaceae bacterium]
MGTLTEAAASLKRAAGSALPALILMTDEVRLADPLPAARALPAGSAIILRHYGVPERATLARGLAAIARRRRLVLLVGEDPVLARRVGAAGVHLPERAIRRARTVRWQRDWLVTAAVHSHAALVSAAACGADAALLSPIFATASHPDQRALGLQRFAALAQASPVPVYALGGIGRAHASLLRGSGAVGIAGIGGLVPQSLGR